MAVDFFHRLIVRGPHKDIRAFQREIYREYPRTIGKESFTEIAPFSFAALYRIAPAAQQIEAEIPYDPYELVAWPVRRFGQDQGEVRYQFQTRNLEMVGLIRVLARVRPSLIFLLVTLCFDDSSIEVYRIQARKTLKWVFPERRRELYWNRARTKFQLAGDYVYEDDAAERWAEGEMLHEALTHWDRKDHDGNLKTCPRYQWWNKPPLRDRATEQQLFMYELAEKLGSKARKKKSKARADTRGKEKIQKKKPARNRATRGNPRV